MPTVEADYSTVHYTTVGNDGPGLVLVAGTGLSAAINYGHLAEAFVDERTVVLPDYAGSGETSGPEGELTVEIPSGHLVVFERPRELVAEVRRFLFEG